MQPPNFDWIKHLAQHLDGRSSVAVVIVIAITMIGMFAGDKGIVLGMFLITPLMWLVTDIMSDHQRRLRDDEVRSLETRSRKKPPLPHKRVPLTRVKN